MANEPVANPWETPIKEVSNALNAAVLELESLKKLPKAEVSKADFEAARAEVAELRKELAALKAQAKGKPAPAADPAPIEDPDEWLSGQWA